MSSHHIVRDNQEPALLILDAETVSFAQVADLLEWSPTVLVCSGSAEKVLSWGIKMDVVLGPATDELKNRLAHQQPIIFLDDPQHSDIANALHYLVTKQFKAVTVFCATEQWADLEVYTLHLAISVVTNNIRWSFIASGKIEKRVPPGTRYYLRQANGQSAFKSENGVICEHRDTTFWLGEPLA